MRPGDGIPAAVVVTDPATGARMGERIGPAALGLPVLGPLTVGAGAPGTGMPIRVACWGRPLGGGTTLGGGTALGVVRATEGGPTAAGVLRAAAGRAGLAATGRGGTLGALGATAG